MLAPPILVTNSCLVLYLTCKQIQLAMTNDGLDGAAELDEQLIVTFIQKYAFPVFYKIQGDEKGYVFGENIKTSYQQYKTINGLATEGPEDSFFYFKVEINEVTFRKKYSNVIGIKNFTSGNGILHVNKIKIGELQSKSVIYYSAEKQIIHLATPISFHKIQTNFVPPSSPARRSKSQSLDITMPRAQQLFAPLSSRNLLNDTQGPDTESKVLSDSAFTNPIPIQAGARSAALKCRLKPVASLTASQAISRSQQLPTVPSLLQPTLIDANQSKKFEDSQQLDESLSMSGVEDQVQSVNGLR